MIYFFVLILFIFIFFYFHILIARKLNSKNDLKEIRKVVNELIVELNKEANKNLNLIQNKLDETKIYLDKIKKANLELKNIEKFNDEIKVDLKHKVKELHLEGYSKRQIALKLRINLEEVDLITNLLEQSSP